MRVGMVTIRASGKGRERFEIRTLVTIQTCNFFMLTEQRELCLRVIEGSDKP